MAPDSFDDVLFAFNPWWEDVYQLDALRRETYLTHLQGDLNTKEICFLTGLRRIGKTTLMKLLIKDLINVNHISPKNIFYVSLDYYGLENYSIHDLVSRFRQIHAHRLSDKIYLFLDEVAYHDKFHQELKNFYDMENMKIFASSSSSSLLRDKKALLTGRSKMVEVLPLQFCEFLQFKGLDIKRSESYLLEKHFEAYMNIGGIPQYVLSEDRSYIKELLDNILYKDIITFHNIKDPQLVRDMLSLIMERAGKQLSLNKIANILNISVDTTRRYLGYFEDTFLIYSIARYGTTNERVRSSKKIYAGDVGLRNALTGFRDKGAVFENLVYLAIKSEHPMYVYQDTIELDFMTTASTLIEVKYNQELNPKQQALFDNFPAKEKIVISSPSQYLGYLNNLK